MSKNSQAKRIARQHKRGGFDRKINPFGGLGVLQKNYFDNTIAPRKLDSDQRFDISKSGWASMLVILKDPAANADHWADLATAANLSLMLAEQGYGQEHEPVIIRAQEALTRMYIRGTEKNIWRLDGQGIQDITDMLHLHDRQCEHATNGDIQQALRTITERVISGNVFEIVDQTAA